ncbi:MAG: sulfatase-like hydrolase/transferase, partial [Opitutaceae bacterium]|nr:sulfatase-like hydrolase/transferase [Opitutaceae bacterium]
FLALLAASFSFLPAARAAAAATPPNIVFIISDDHAWTDYGHMGHKVIETPHLDKLAARSAVFERGYVPTALCRPALATFATGLYAHQHKVSGNDPAPLPTAVGSPETTAKNAGKSAPADDAAKKNKRAAKAKAASADEAAARPSGESPPYLALREKLIRHLDAVPTVPRLLGARGYLSHQSGKWWEGSYQRGGFTHGMTRGFPLPGGRHGDDGLKIGREGMKPIFDFIDHATAEKKPFFVWYAPFLPHTPHTPPDRLFQKYKAKGVASDFVAKYYAMVEWFDETCGALLGRLDEKGLRENTLVIYIADNGWIQNPTGPGYAPRSKQTANEGGTRQPTMFSWPGVIQPGRRGQQLCSSIDIVPTLLAAAGAAAPANLPGLNLLPVLRSGAPTSRDTVFGETFAHDIADLDQPAESLVYRWVIEGKWKLLLTYDGYVSARYASSNPRAELRPQLFDLLADPHEDNNLAAQNPAVVARLAAKLDGWWKPAGRQVQTAWTP